MSDEAVKKDPNEAEISINVPCKGMTEQEEKALIGFLTRTGKETAVAIRSLIGEVDKDIIWWVVNYLIGIGKEGANGRIVKLCLKASPREDSPREVVFEWTSNELLNFKTDDDFISRFNEDVGKFVQKKQK